MDVETRGLTGADLLSHGFTQLDGDSLHLGVLGQGVLSSEEQKSRGGQGQTRVEKKPLGIFRGALLQLSTNAGHFIAAEGCLSVQGVIAIYPEEPQEKGRKDNISSICFFFLHFLKPEIKNEEMYQTVPVSRAAEADRALSILEVKMADTRPYFELFALLMASSWLLKLNMHCTGPKI